MKSSTRQRRQQGKSGIELVEEAVHLLRSAPAATWAAYLAGALPFILALLYFIADMSRSAFATSRLAGASLGMALLYVWMKFWHVLFAARLRAVATGTAPAPVSLGRCRRILLTQAALQPLMFFVLPMAALLTLPFGWAYAFFQSVTALGQAEADDSGLLIRKAWRQANLWQRQNHVAVLIIFTFGLFVFVNWLSFCLLLPQLVKILFGVETVFTRSGMSMLNSTLLAVVLGLTYLSVAPVLKSLYCLRCFYGESLVSGEDLKSELTRFARTRAASILVCVACGCTGLSALAGEVGPAANLLAVQAEVLSGGLGSPAAEAPAQPSSGPERGATPTPAGQTESIDPTMLDSTVERVLSQRKYAWRLPREKEQAASDQKPGWIAQFLLLVRDWINGIIEWLRDLWNKLSRSGSRSGGGGLGWITWLHLLLYGLAALILAVLIYFVYRIWRDRRNRPVTLALPLAPVPDVADEDVGADQLPEDGWLNLARELVARGELRLALRALYLGSLAHLAQRQLVTLAKFKSNRDYERELRRRGHSSADLLAAFGENVVEFDRAWYGRHAVDSNLVDRFYQNVERIRGGVAGGGA